jgi:hypothetical protein
MDDTPGHISNRSVECSETRLIPDKWVPLKRTSTKSPRQHEACLYAYLVRPRKAFVRQRYMKWWMSIRVANMAFIRVLFKENISVIDGFIRRNRSIALSQRALRNDTGTMKSVAGIE